jgi:excinuclease ABC subunit A
MSHKKIQLYKPKEDVIEVVGAKEHNLRDVSLSIPRNKLVVFSGLSGSGKSSLAFDTLYAEGQRRYLETFSAYARQFIGNMDRPEVEQIYGLSPVISIEQKTTGWNPRSTVGTITEIYDLLRLLYARIGEAHSYLTGEKMIKFTEEEVLEQIKAKFDQKKIAILAPLVKGRKGHYRELFDQVRKQGFTKVRVDGVVLELKSGLQVERFKTHDIEVVVDRLTLNKEKYGRLHESTQSAFKIGEGLLLILDIESDETLPFSKELMDASSGLSYEEPSPNSFSFNSPYGACPHCKGMGQLNKVEVEKVIPDPSLSINAGGLAPLGEVRKNQTFEQLRKIAKKYKFSFATPISEFPEEALKVILYGGDESFQVKTNLYNDYSYDLAKEGLVKMLEKWYEDTSSERIRNWAEAFMALVPCSECEGFRLKKESLHFYIDGKHIGQIANLDFYQLNLWFSDIETRLSAKQNTIAKDIIKEIRYRLHFLLHVGLDYLHLNRPARTLSGGEAQRTRLANQIGSKLTGITYIMDEPSIGLHQKDNVQLIAALKELTAIGNSVLVVEHDKDIMKAADYLFDLGPGAGVNGGYLVNEGTPEEFMAKPSLTADYLSGRKNIEIPSSRRSGNGFFLELTKATGNNLKDVSIKIPLGTMTCVTGVSGSGKSTLINDTLYPILRRHFYNASQNPLSYQSIAGLEHLDKVIEIDQSPIGRTPRSNPATYTNLFTEIRKLFAEVPEAKIRGYSLGRFSFNVKGGRCEVCGGAGQRVIEMNFLPDVHVDCETCLGRRYNRETLEIIYKGKSISDVLNMTVDEATEFFVHIPKIFSKLKIMKEVGLGYITLGQQATTLSGGEAQRVKLSEELAKKDTGKTLYIMDEPTTGLHFQDVSLLLEVIHSLVEKGNTVLIIEHNMDVIKMADYVIDIGPEGGRKGGEVVGTGTPEELVKKGKGYTAQFLKEELK